jgi:ATP-binding cassette subfamily B protein/ATP-binding cassette subfamily C protein LapB
MLEQDELLYAYKYILDFYFGEVSLETIEGLRETRNSAFTFDDITSISKEVRLYIDSDKHIPSRILNHLLPAIVVHTKRNRASVLLRVDEQEATIYDPINQSHNTIPTKRLKKEFNQIIYLFRNEDDKELVEIDKQNKEWFYGPIKKEWRAYVEAGILTVFINVFVLALPLFTMSVYDRVIPNFATDTLKVLGLGVLIIFMFDIIFKGVRSYIIEGIGKRIGNTLEEELMKKVLIVNTHYDDMLIGAKANLFKELNHIRNFFASKTMIHILDFPFFILLVYVIYLILPQAAAIPIVGAFFILLFNYIMQIPMQTLSQKNFKDTQSKHSFLVETIQGNESLRLANALPKRLFEWRQIVAFTNQIALKMQMYTNFANNVSTTIIQIITLAVITIGVYQIHDNQLSIGGLIAITILASRAMVPIVQFSTVIINYKEFKEALITLNNFWYLPHENKHHIEMGIGKIEGQIEFSDVTYYHKNAQIPSAKDLNFIIKPGEKVGIIGQTGAGKSTILRMLTGLDHPNSGTIFLDQFDISTMHSVEIRKNIGVMPQEPFLFSGTLKENIELSESISKERIAEVIKKTGLETLVKKSRLGDSLQVGERGSNLSVGQRHLVALARAILNEPPILILDEPTTGLDIGLEQQLIAHIKQFTSDKTLLLITHRLAALELVDRVIVINNGQIAVDGPRDKVLNYLKQGKN